VLQAVTANMPKMSFWFRFITGNCIH
jgi:hypothetical protein